MGGMNGIMLASIAPPPLGGGGITAQVSAGAHGHQHSLLVGHSALRMQLLPPRSRGGLRRPTLRVRVLRHAPQGAPVVVAGSGGVGRGGGGEQTPVKPNVPDFGDVLLLHEGSATAIYLPRPHWSSRMWGRQRSARPRAPRPTIVFDCCYLSWAIACGLMTTNAQPIGHVCLHERKT